MEKNCDSILIIEDNYEIREALEEWLRDEGYRVYAVKNGREAMAVLRLIPGRSLILLDMMMPVMDGWEFLEAQRQHALFGKLPVVVVSALGVDSALAHKNRALPAVGYIRKPISLPALMEIVQTYCKPMQNARYGSVPAA